MKGEINLISPAQKQFLLQERNKKTAILLWLLPVFLVFSFSLIIFSANIYLGSEVGAQKSVLAIVQSASDLVKVNDLKAKFSAFDQDLKKANSFYSSQVSMSAILEQVSSILPNDAYLADFSEKSIASKGAKPYIQVSVSGNIGTRESLLNFKNSLEAQKNISDVSFPPQNWVDPANINFFVTFNILPK